MQNRNIPQAVFERTIKNGYVLDPSILPESELLDAIESVVGISGEKANAAFHKSWSVVQNASIESLIIQQIIHYITTYGFEQLGIYREDAVYVPREVLDLPNIHIANYYNFQADDPVDCKIITAHENPKRFGKNYMIDVKNMVSTANIKISRRQNILGLIININGESRVYFTNISIGNSITSSKADWQRYEVEKRRRTDGNNRK